MSDTMSNNIIVNFGAYSIEYTPDELKEICIDNMILMDAFLLAYNRPIAEQADLMPPFEELLEALREIYDKHSDYSKEFIDLVFDK